MAKYKVATLTMFSQTFELEKEILAKAGGELTALKAAPEDELIRLLKDVDAVLIGRTKITEKMIDGLKACKIIVCYGIGVDNIDVAAAARRNILVSNVPDYCIDEVSDHTRTPRARFGKWRTCSSLLTRHGTLRRHLLSSTVRPQRRSPGSCGANRRFTRSDRSRRFNTHTQIQAKG